MLEVTFEFTPDDLAWLRRQTQQDYDDWKRADPTAYAAWLKAWRDAHAAFVFGQVFTDMALDRPLRKPLLLPRPCASAA